MLNMDEDREMERFAKLAKEISYDLGIDEEYIRDLVADWAVDSHSTSGVIMQLAAVKEFGAKLSDYTLNLAQRSGINIDADFQNERQILRWIYDNNSHYTRTLYRASSGRNALESWTTDREIAEFYVERNGEGEVIEMDIDGKNILGTYQYGIGLECTNEVLVINR